MSMMEPFFPVSDKPALSRDLSYCVAADASEEDICDRIREVFGDQHELLEQVQILMRTPYDHLLPVARDRLGARSGQVNVLVRVVLRHPDRTLTRREAAQLYAQAYPLLHEG